MNETKRLLEETEEREKAQDGAVSSMAGSVELDYWKKRCELAEAFIESHAADPDITSEMCFAYSAWTEFRDVKVVD